MQRDLFIGIMITFVSLRTASTADRGLGVMVHGTAAAPINNNLEPLYVVVEKRKATEKKGEAKRVPHSKAKKKTRKLRKGSRLYILYQSL